MLQSFLEVERLLDRYVPIVHFVLLFPKQKIVISREAVETNQ